jgi:hypothetical protein
MQSTKALLLGALFVGMGTVTAINEIGITVYPPSGQFPDGHWHRCATTLVRTQDGAGNGGSK